MKLNSSFYFLIGLTIWLVFHWLVMQGYTHPILNNYLDDLLFIPLVMGFALHCQRYLILGNPLFCYKKPWVWLFLGYSILVFEIVFPLTNMAYTRDPLDILAYAIGAILFQHLINKPYPSPLISNSK